MNSSNTDQNSENPIAVYPAIIFIVVAFILFLSPPGIVKKEMMMSTYNLIPVTLGIIGLAWFLTYIFHPLSKKRVKKVGIIHPEVFQEFVAGFEYNIFKDKFIFTKDHPFSNLGISKEDFTLFEFLDIIDDKEREKFNLAFIKIIRERIPFSLEFQVRITDERINIFSIKGRVFLDETGETECVSGIIQDITTHRKKEEAIRIYEQQLSEARKIAHLGTWSYDFELDTLDISPETLRIFGLSDSREAPKQFTDLKTIFPVTLMARIKQAFTGVDDSSRNLDIEYPYSHPDGSTRIHRTVSGFIFDKDGKPLRAIGITQDITTFKDTEKKLLEHKERLERTQELAQIAFFDYNWADQNFNMSSEMHNILELENNYNQLNHAILDKIFPDDIVRLRGHAFLPPEGAIERKGEVEFRIVAPNGRVKYIYAQYEHRYNQVGHRLTSSGWLQDVTSHRINEIALAESEEKYRNMFALESDALFLCDNDTGEILETNAAATNMFGYTAMEFHQIKAYDLMRDRELIKDRLKHHHELLHNTILITKSGQEVLAMVSLAYFIWKGRNVHLAAIRDVSKLSKLEEQIRHSEKMNAVGQLAGGIAHDFNNQLMGISGYAHLLKEKIRDNQLLGYVQNIIRASEHSTDLTGKLLAFSRKGKYISVSNDAHELIKECVMLLKPGLGKQVEINVQEQAENPVFEGDTSSIQNAILNIAINARDAMGNGGTIHITTRNITVDQKTSPFRNLANGEYLKIVISDSGIGIPKDHLEKIFEPFFSTKSKEHGTGLGLSATFGTIEAHNGTITVDSTPGEGSTFTIFLPSSEAPVREGNDKENSTVYGEGIIMLVDDEDIVREVTSIMIRNLGYNVVEFNNGPEGIEYYRENGDKVAAVILDLMMPGMSGYEVFSKLKSLNNDVKVLLFSGFSANDEVQKAMKQGAAGYLQKPAGKENLSQQLARLAGKTKYFAERQAEDIDYGLPTIKMLDIEKALRQVDGDAIILEQVFLNFIKRYHSIVDKMKDMSQKNNLSGLYINIHSLKSLLGTMGATELFIMAEELEKNLDSRNPDPVDRDPRFDMFCNNISLLISQLDEWKNKKYPNENHHIINKEVKSGEELLKIIKRIEKLIHQFSPANITEITEICDSISWPPIVQGDIEDMLELLDDFDFEEAGKRCQKIETTIK